MADAPRPGNALPVGLDRGALERVLTRAAELQATASDTPEQLSEAQLVALGQEVGVSAEHIRQALAEEKTRVTVPEVQGVVAKYFGPSTAQASRVVRGKPEIVLAALDRMMQHDECLQVKRRFGDRITWEKRTGVIVTITRNLDVAGRGYRLASVPEVGGSVVLVDATRVLVHLDAQIAERRSRTFGVAMVLAGLAVATGVGFVALPLIVGGSLGVGAAVGGALAGVGGSATATIAKGQRKFVERVQLALEQVLDRLESNAAQPPSVLGVLSDVARRLS